VKTMRRKLHHRKCLSKKKELRTGVVNEAEICVGGWSRSSWDDNGLQSGIVGGKEKAGVEKKKKKCSLTKYD